MYAYINTNKIALEPITRIINMIHNNIVKSIFWFRRDLRLADNPGFSEAVKNGLVLPIFILDPHALTTMGQSSRWWLHNSLQKLNQSLNNSLRIYQGNPEDILVLLAQKYSITKIYWNTCYEPAELAKDVMIKKHLAEIGIAYETFCAQLLWEPSTIVKGDKTPYKVFTFFYRNGCLGSKPPRRPLATPNHIQYLENIPHGSTIEELNLITDSALDKRLQKIWKVGEQAAQTRLQNFLNDGFTGYKEGRNYPARKNVSRLSPHLHFGEISPNQAWYAALEKKGYMQLDPDLDTFLNELGWREFSYNLLYNFPNLPHKNFQPKFDNFPWHTNAKFLQAWQQGQTGYPIVDAGMRELAQTGYMHNRVRMVVASFLIKNLLLHWHHGRDWFWEHLVDADLASNSASWQWVAGSGADAAPYFRIFNPITQGEKFDSDGDYTRHFVPELQSVPDKFLFEPWKAPQIILFNAGVILGENYPMPIVSVEDSRKKALEAYKSL
jgi:deoxyribodipyrimidine photo-lyase